MDAWTADRVLSLAPDAASASAGQSLANLAKWSGLGRTDRALWGLCQGSGKNPYQTRVDLSEPAFKCSCPSRKFPCKHGIALLLLLSKYAAQVPTAGEPEWVTEWMASRSDRAEKKAARTTEPESAPDPAAQAKRAAQRAERVADGIAACRVWVEDLARRGLAAAQTEPASTWDRTAARMVDAQAPGIASMIRRFAELLNSGPGWEVRVSDHLAKINLLLLAGDRLDELAPDLAETVRATIGWPQAKEAVLASDGTADRWMVLAQAEDDDDRIRVRRTWLVGRATTHRALLLDFAPANQPFDQTVFPGTEFEADLAFYPGALQLRALIRTREEAQPLSTPTLASLDSTCEDALIRYARALAADPWLSRWPCCLDQATVRLQRGRWVLADAASAALPLNPAFIGSTAMWKLLSITGAHPSPIIAEWNGEHATPLSVVTTRGLTELVTRWAA